MHTYCIGFCFKHLFGFESAVWISHQALCSCVCVRGCFRWVGGFWRCRTHEAHWVFPHFLSCLVFSASHVITLYSELRPKTFTIRHKPCLRIKIYFPSPLCCTCLLEITLAFWIWFDNYHCCLDDFCAFSRTKNSFYAALSLGEVVRDDATSFRFLSLWLGLWSGGRFLKAHKRRRKWFCWNVLEMSLTNCVPFSGHCDICEFHLISKFLSSGGFFHFAHLVFVFLSTLIVLPCPSCLCI